MPSPRSTLFPLLLLLALATSASAQDDPGSRTGPGDLHEGFFQVVYKGLVGNVLDAIPMDPSKRLDLQRANAVVGNTFLGRSLAVLAGLSNPVLLLGGFVWGVWAASNIKPAEAGTKLTADLRQSGGDASTQELLVALLALPTAVGDPPAESVAPSQQAVAPPSMKQSQPPLSPSIEQGSPPEVATRSNQPTAVANERSALASNVQLEQQPRLLQASSREATQPTALPQSMTGNRPYPDLMTAIMFSDTNAVEDFLSRGVNINRSEGGLTYLIAAVRSGNVDMVKFLMSKGADVNRADSRGLTPIVHAKAAGPSDVAMIQFLEGAGAINPFAKLADVQASKGTGS